MDGVRTKKQSKPQRGETRRNSRDGFSGIENHKGDPGWRQTEIIPICQRDNSNKDLSWRQIKSFPRRQRKQRGIPEKEYPGIFIPEGYPSWRQKEKNSVVPAGKLLRRDNFYIVYNFYVDPSWRQKEIISKCQQENFVPAEQLLRSVQFLRRSKLAPKESIPRCQRDIFAPTEFEIQIWV